MKKLMPNFNDHAKSIAMWLVINPVDGRHCVPMFNLTAIVAIIVRLLAGGAPVAAQVFKGEAAFGGWQMDKPGVTRLLRAQDLPASVIPKSVTNNPPDRVAIPSDVKPLVPEGFSATAGR